jgi:histone acetyltransferase (RNA polymerase elongator complex component)
MARTWTLRFPPPEPPADKVRLVPFFLPFAGCPGRCAFCDQQAQTGQGVADPDSALRELEERLAGARPPFGLGFFGGTFTGLPVAWQDRFLAAAARFRRAGGLVHVRVSTRPDRIDMGMLARLRGQGVDMVELGVQTFDSGVLARSGRGYTGDAAVRACEMVRKAGMALGIQLLPGLPGHDAALWSEDVERSLALKPDTVRMYPCVVMAGTGLSAMFAGGEYVPWSLEEAVRACGQALLAFWGAGVRVIRLGLAGEPAMLARLVAGPWHPAFGNMARSLALRLFLEQRLRLAGGRLVRMTVPARLCGELWGHGRANAPALAELGIDKDRVTFRSQTEFVVELEE